MPTAVAVGSVVAAPDSGAAVVRDVVLWATVTLLAETDGHVVDQVAAPPVLVKNVPTTGGSTFSVKIPFVHAGRQLSVVYALAAGDYEPNLAVSASLAVAPVSVLASDGVVTQRWT